MAVPLLRQLLAVVKTLLLAGKRLAKDTWVRLLRKAALLWTLLRATLRIGTRKRRRDPEGPRTTTTTDTTRDANNPSEKPTTSTNTTPEPTATTDTDRDRQIIPLDSRISCSLHPVRGPYINTNLSHASLQHGLRAARSAHSFAVSSRNASRSRMSFVPSPEAQSLQEEFTFEVKSPDHPLSPTSAKRQYSISSPQLGGSGSRPNSGLRNAVGYDVEVNSLQRAPSITRTQSSTPQGSTTALPAGDTFSVNASVHDVQLNNGRIFPIVPQFFQRYDRLVLAKDEETNVTIPAFTLDYRDKPDPQGWKPILHPEGVLYFYNEGKKAVTEANLYDERIYTQVMENIAVMEHHVHSNNIPLPRNYTLAMDLTLTEAGTIITDYYYADHDRNIIFFLDDLDASVNLPVWEQVKGVSSLYHIRHEMEAQYW
ncbi:hypothetical protein NMY22_g16256 [Coprinellus aureogranulatus]|nr:hypothetical protein NMY22_g16256 [Coprinellus aureogranulatus]